MDEKKQIYQWSKRDKMLHLLPAAFLIAFYVGTIYLLAVKSTYLVVIFILLWIITNAAVTGICAGCPYRGGYCPGISQLYFAPFLSLMVSKGQRKEPGARSFKLNLVVLGVCVVGSYLFTFYWLFHFYWPERAVIVLALLGSLLLHMPLSFFILCPKCGYNDVCPMANVHKAFKRGIET